MIDNYLQYLRCISCNGDNIFIQQNKERKVIKCGNCREEYRIVNSIPRFVNNEQYTRSFGLEWNIHRLTQYDGYYGKNLSEKRFFNETGWERDLSNQIVIEAGCGSGRFTEWALKTNATVLSFDLSNAVEANMKNNGNHPNLLILQADIFNIPFKKEIADKLFCFGVLQHTHNPKIALFSLIPFCKKNGGEIVFDIYKKKFHTKYFIRPLVKYISPEILYKICKDWINFMWPIANILRRISPKYGPKINWQLMVADYSREGIPADKLKEWALLDTFDMLSPIYDIPASLEEVKEWLNELKDKSQIKSFTLKYGFNGIEGKIYR